MTKMSRGEWRLCDSKESSATNCNAEDPDFSRLFPLQHNTKDVPSSFLEILPRYFVIEKDVVNGLGM